MLMSPKLFSQDGVSISSSIAPPPLPDYEQPPCPVDGYLWTPGSWGYSDEGYYWVPGVWVSPPEIGFLWTPCYWGFDLGIYGWHQGYWGRHIGFYGGVNYGYGYGGNGFGGGRWEGSNFRYNTAVVNINPTIIHNTYIDRTVIINNRNINSHTSFNGGAGTNARPTPSEQMAMKEHHLDRTNEQATHQQNASQNKGQLVSNNHGKPAMLTFNRVGGHTFGQQQHGVIHSPTNTIKHDANRPNPGSNNNVHQQAVVPNRNPMQSQGFGNKPNNVTPNNHPAPIHEHAKVQPQAASKVESNRTNPVLQPRPQQVQRPQLPTNRTAPQMPSRPQQPQHVMRPPAAPAPHIENRKEH